MLFVMPVCSEKEREREKKENKRKRKEREVNPPLLSIHPPPPPLPPPLSPPPFPLPSHSPPPLPPPFPLTLPPPSLPPSLSLSPPPSLPPSLSLSPPPPSFKKKKGVCKALIQHDVLPRVISGTSGGAIVAGYLAIFTGLLYIYIYIYISFIYILFYQELFLGRVEGLLLLVIWLFLQVCGIDVF